MNEPLPLATIQRAVFEFLHGREDCVVYGAQSINAYVNQTRATEEVDIESTRAQALAQDIRRYLGQRFDIATRVRTVRQGAGYRIYQVRKPENRHLVDIRTTSHLPPKRLVEGIPVIEPAVAIARKVVSYAAREHQDKGLTDARDLRLMLRAFPELKRIDSEVADHLEQRNADDRTFTMWRQWVQQPLEDESEDDEFDW